MQIVSLIVIGLGLLIGFGGVVGIRSGKMQKVQFGSSTAQLPATLEGAAARRQGIGYIAAGVVLIALGLVLMSSSVAGLFILIALVSLAGGVYMAFLGGRCIQKRDVVFQLTIRGRSHANYIRSTRVLNHHYTGSAAVVVGVGYLLVAIGLIALGLILLLKPDLLVAGVVLGLVGFGLWVLSDVIASRMSATA